MPKARQFLGIKASPSSSPALSAPKRENYSELPRRDRRKSPELGTMLKELQQVIEKFSKGKERAHAAAITSESEEASQYTSDEEDGLEEIEIAQAAAESRGTLNNTK